MIKNPICTKSHFFRLKIPITRTTHIYQLKSNLIERRKPIYHTNPRKYAMFIRYPYIIHSHWMKLKKRITKARIKKINVLLKNTHTHFS